MLSVLSLTASVNSDSGNSTKDNTTKSAESFKIERKTVDITLQRDKGVLKEIKRSGTGDDRPLKGDTVYLHYVGRLEDGTEFDSCRKGTVKFQVVLDSNDGKSSINSL